MMDTNQTASISRETLISFAADILSAYVSNNAITAGDVPVLLGNIHSKLGELANSETKAERAINPAVPIAKSINDDYLVCLEDGAKLKLMKRYLRTRYNLTPEEYRARWGLPADYPMVSPAYARTRSAFAKKIGLGQKSGSKA